MRFVWRLMALAIPTILLAGCSINTIATKSAAPAPEPTPYTNKGSLAGIVHGGQFPIIGARIYMMAVSIGAYNLPSASLINPAKSGHSDSLGGYEPTLGDGTFIIPSNVYTCTSGQQIYLYSRGGNPQQGISDNESAGLMAVLGDCAGLSGLPSIQMNEITTVAAAYALAGFANDAIDISSSTTNLTGLKNAVGNAGNLASFGGLAQATGDANGVTLQQTIITLANILAACINETSGKNSCTTLFSDVKSGGTTGSTAGETATEAIYIAHNPGTSTGSTGIFSLITGNLAFMQPPGDLASAPNDWTLAITWNAFEGVTGVAVDASGDAWFTNDGSSANSISERGPLGQNLSGASGFSGGGSLGAPTGIAIDDASPPNLWITNPNSSTITRVVSTTPNLGTTFSNNGLNIPYGVAIDALGHIWVTNIEGDGVSEFSSSGGGLGSFNAPDTGGNTQFMEPDGIAIDPAGAAGGNIWVTNAGDVDGGNYGTSIVELNNAGSPFNHNGGYTGGGVLAPIDAALDHSGNVWISNFESAPTGNGSISEFAGGALSGPIKGGGVDGTYGGPYGIAVDGDGKVWTANLGPGQANAIGSISAYNPATSSFLSPANGFQPGLNKPNGIAIDASGNVWVTNNGDSSITELVGAAAPAVVPLVTGVKNNALGTRP